MQPTQPQIPQSRWQRLSSGLKSMWIAWITLSILLAACTLLFQLAVYTPQLPIVLNTGQRAEITVWRPWSHPAKFELQFKRNPGQARPELGEWVTPAAPANEPSAPSLVFSKPGDPVKILVEVAGQQTPLSALPATSSDNNSSTVERPLAPSSTNDNPSELVWPSATQSAVTQAAGKSQYRFTVQEVGSHLQGEQVQLLLVPPLNFKSAQPGYDWLWPLFFWPTFAALLAVFGAILLWLSWRQLKTQPTALNT